MTHMLWFKAVCLLVVLWSKWSKHSQVQKIQLILALREERVRTRVTLNAPVNNNHNN